jgi:hypothetical protein
MAYKVSRDSMLRAYECMCVEREVLRKQLSVVGELGDISILYSQELLALEVATAEFKEVLYG